MAIKGLGQFEKYKTISNFRKLLEEWHISSFQIDSGRLDCDYGFAKHLSKKGENLAQAAFNMSQYHPKIFQKIIEDLPKRIPGITKVEATPSEDGMIRLRFTGENFKSPFLVRRVSDGTIKMFAYMLLLNDPEPHPLLCIEEPENFLHPDLMLGLSEEIRQYSQRG